jgi:citronellol/citronellal dehydrogenase
MTLLSLGFQEEVRARGITVRTLWPATLIATAAVGMFAGDEGLNVSRKPTIMADAAFELINRRESMGQEVSWLDESVLRKIGVESFTQYAQVPENEKNIQRDFYIGTY